MLFRSLSARLRGHFEGIFEQAGALLCLGDGQTSADAALREDCLRGYSVAAIAEATGEMAGLTQVFVDPEYPEWGHQGLTAVIRQHRGHRLGLLIKAAMLEWLATEEPKLERIATDNAAVNKYMIAVNETLGYELVKPDEQSFQLAVSPG